MPASEGKSLWELLRKANIAGELRRNSGAFLCVPGNHVWLLGDRSRLYGKLLDQPQRPSSCPEHVPRAWRQNLLFSEDICLGNQQMASELAARVTHFVRFWDRLEPCGSFAKMFTTDIHTELTMRCLFQTKRLIGWLCFLSIELFRLLWLDFLQEEWAYLPCKVSCLPIHWSPIPAPWK